MPAPGEPGSVWGVGTWGAGTWGANTWGAAQDTATPFPVVIGARGRLRFAPMVGIAHLLDHTMKVWRPVESRSARMATVRTYVVVYESIACAVNRPRNALAVREGGIIEQGITRVYCDVGPVLRARDVVQLTSGPESPLILEVESPCKPRGHHIELAVSNFVGSLGVEIS